MARLLQKVKLSSTAKISCFTALKNFDHKIREKKDLIGDFRYLEVFIWKDSRIVRPKFEQGTVQFSFFTALDWTEYWER